MMQNVKKC